MPSTPVAVSVIVPTFREAPNIKTLAERLFDALARTERKSELIIVDDNSRDDTEAIVESLSAKYPIRLILRREERGLSTAVLAGFRAAKYDRFVVLDADLQHPPEMVPELLDTLETGDCDFVFGSRYAAGGEIVGDWPWMRRVGSLVATLLARPLAPLRDPLSGFFALNRKTWEDADTLDPIGYKIGLELYIKGRCSRPVELPIRFKKRHAGTSKLGVAEQVRFLRHLGRLYRFRYPIHTGLALFAVIVGGGTAVLMLLRTLFRFD